MQRTGVYLLCMDTSKQSNNDRPLETTLSEKVPEEPKKMAEMIMEEERTKLAEKHGVPREACSKRMGIWYIHDKPAD